MHCDLSKRHSHVTLLATAAVTLLLYADAARAQTGAETGGTTGATPPAVRTDNDDNDGFPWGLLGLAGLAGLAGLKPRRDHVRVHGDARV